MNKKELGNLGEQAAVLYLKNKGYKILETNYENKKGKKIGEIDVITRKGNLIVFIEVKTRQFDPDDLFLPEENITRSKLYKLQKIGQLYIRENDLWHLDYRFDCISITIKNNQPFIRHLESIFI